MLSVYTRPSLYAFQNGLGYMVLFGFILSAPEFVRTIRNRAWRRSAGKSHGVWELVWQRPHHCSTWIEQLAGPVAVAVPVSPVSQSLQSLRSQGGRGPHMSLVRHPASHLPLWRTRYTFQTHVQTHKDTHSHTHTLVSPPGLCGRLAKTTPSPMV